MHHSHTDCSYHLPWPCCSRALESRDNTSSFRIKPRAQIQHMQVKVIIWNSFHQVNRFHDQGNSWVSLLLESTTEAMEQREAVFSNQFYMPLKTEITCFLLVFALLKSSKSRQWSLEGKKWPYLLQAIDQRDKTEHLWTKDFYAFSYLASWEEK